MSWISIIILLALTPFIVQGIFMLCTIGVMAITLSIAIIGTIIDGIKGIFK
jgi:hypothetical protein